MQLNLDFWCGEDVFTTTENHLIYINANLFSDIDYLKSECFSAYYSQTNNSFANEFVKRYMVYHRIYKELSTSVDKWQIEL